ncbi:hypothetical protein ACKWTF_003147 [Chironomus riparius]
MKCILGFLVLTVGVFQMISGGPIRSSGMVFYQPEYYNAHRAFVMQYASQPVKSYRRQGQASGVSAFASGKKIATGTYLRQEETEDPHVAHSVAEAYPGGPPQHHSEEDNTEVSLDEDQSPENVIPQENIVPPEIAHDDPNDEIPEAPVAVIPNKNKKTPPVANDEEEEDEEEEEEKNVVKRTKNRPASGTTYFPVSFGSTNGGAIAIANSYSTGKGEKKIVILMVDLEKFIIQSAKRLNN